MHTIFTHPGTHASPFRISRHAAGLVAGGCLSAATLTGCDKRPRLGGDRRRGGRPGRRRPDEPGHAAVTPAAYGAAAGSEAAAARSVVVGLRR